MKEVKPGLKLFSINAFIFYYALSSERTMVGDLKNVV